MDTALMVMMVRNMAMVVVWVMVAGVVVLVVVSEMMAVKKGSAKRG